MFLGDYLTAIQYLIDQAFDGNKYTCCFNKIIPTFDRWLFKTDTETYILYRNGKITKFKGNWKNGIEETIYEGGSEWSKQLS